MAIINHKFVYRDGNTSPGAPTNGFIFADTFAELQGITDCRKGDLGHVTTDNNRPFWCNVPGDWYKMPLSVDIPAPTGVTQTFGNWSPTIGGVDSGAGNHVYQSRVGYWIRTGLMVWIAGLINVSAKGTMSGGIQLQGLPHSSNSYTVLSIGHSSGFQANDGTDTFITGISNGGTNVYFYYSQDGGYSPVANSNVRNAFSLYFSMVYWS